MEAKRGKKRALESDGSQSDNGEMAGMVGKARRGSLRGGEEEEEMVEGFARAVQGPARAVLPTPPAKRMGKSRAASSDLILNPIR